MTNRNETYIALDADLTSMIAKYIIDFDIETNSYNLIDDADLDIDYFIDTDITDDADRFDATEQYLTDYIDDHRDEIRAALRELINPRPSHIPAIYRSPIFETDE